MVGSAENRASSAPIELGLGLSLAKYYKIETTIENLGCILGGIICRTKSVWVFKRSSMKL